MDVNKNAQKEDGQTGVDLTKNSLDKEQNSASAPLIVSAIMVVFSIAAAYGWLTGIWGTVEVTTTIITVSIGAISAFFTKTKFGSIFFVTEFTGAFLLWIVAAIADLILDGFTILWVFTDIILGLFITIPICAFPALIGAVAVTILKKLFALLKDS